MKSIRGILVILTEFIPFMLMISASYGAAIWDSAPGVYGHPGMPLVIQDSLHFLFIYLCF